MTTNGTETRLARREESLDFSPAFSIETAVERFNTLSDFIGKIMHKDIDFGAIPGTTKPTLLKPGAEKLCTFFGLRKVPEIVEKIEDWTGQDHNGEPFFLYVYRFNLYRGDVLIAAADGSCNSWEKKYRWRDQQRVCPACGKPSIIKGKEEYGGGWVCFKKKDGCGAKFADDAPAIVTQQVGRIPNPDVCDLPNTIMKMAQKRALVAATLLAVNASEFFTQDAEDGVIDADHEYHPPKQEAKPEPVKKQPKKDDPPAQLDPRSEAFAEFSKVYSEAQKINAVDAAWGKKWCKDRGSMGTVELSTEQLKELTADVRQRIALTEFMTLATDNKMTDDQLQMMMIHMQPPMRGMGDKDPVNLEAMPEADLRRLIAEFPNRPA